MAKRPSARPTANQVLEAIEAILTGRPLPAPRQARARRLALVALGVGLAAALLGLLLAL